jgi:23S rRNA pseudouridine2605 synthase
VEGKLLNPENAGPMKTRVWAVHKLAGEMVSENDPSKRPTIIERLNRDGFFKKQNIHLKPIGRLDMNTEGLLLLTNDGEFSRQMELPRNQIHRVYRVRVHGLWSQYKLDALRRGMTIKKVRYAPMKVEFDYSRKNRSTNQWMKITCAEGKNRQIRKSLEVLGLKVTRLIRISYGDYQLQTIPRGLGIEVPVKPVKTQKRKGPLFPKVSTKESDKNEEDENDKASPVQWVRAVKS